MPTPNETKMELGLQQNRVWVLGGLVTGLVLLVQGFFTYVITSTGTELRETNRGLVELVSTVKVQQTQIDFLRQEVKDLQDSKKEAGATHRSYETRMGTMEQRLALHDQWIDSHK